MSNRTTLKGFFNTGDVPIESEFVDLIDSLFHSTDDNADKVVESSTRKWLTPNERAAIAAMPVLSTTIQTGSFTAVVGVIHPVQTSGGAVTVAPPATPLVGDRFGITDVRRFFGTNSCLMRFQPSGQRFCADSSSNSNLTLNVKDQCVVFEYLSASYGWVVISGAVN
jgi:hypothetical protein